MSGIKTRIKIDGNRQTLGGGDPPSVSERRSQWNKKWNKNQWNKKQNKNQQNKNQWGPQDPRWWDLPSVSAKRSQQNKKQNKNQGYLVLLALFVMTHLMTSWMLRNKSTWLEWSVYTVFGSSCVIMLSFFALSFKN